MLFGVAAARMLRVVQGLRPMKQPASDKGTSAGTIVESTSPIQSYVVDIVLKGKKRLWEELILNKNIAKVETL